MFRNHGVVFGVVLLSIVGIAANESGLSVKEETSYSPTIGVMIQFACQPSNSKPEPELLLLGVYADGAWRRENFDDLLPTKFDDKPSEFSPEEQQQIDALLGETFFAAYDSSISFTATATHIRWILGNLRLSLLGKLSGVKDTEDTLPNTIMANRKLDTKAFRAEHLQDDSVLKNHILQALKVPAEELKQKQDAPIETFAHRIKGLELREAATEVLMKILDKQMSEEIQDDELETHFKKHGIETSEVEQLLMEGIGAPESSYATFGIKKNESADVSIEEREKNIRKVVTIIAEFFTELDNRRIANKPKIDLNAYEPVQIQEVIAFDFQKEKKALWVHATRPYPKGIAPKDDLFPNFPMWTGEYFGLLETLEEGKYRVLWEQPLMYRNHREPIERIFLGACDANVDGSAEVIFAESAYEYYGCVLYTLVDDQYVKTCCAGGGL